MRRELWDRQSAPWETGGKRAGVTGGPGHRDALRKFGQVNEQSSSQTSCQSSSISQEWACPRPPAALSWWLEAAVGSVSSTWQQW